MNDVLKIPDVARELGLSPWTVRRLLVARVLKGVRTGEGKYATWLIPRQSLDDFLGVRARSSTSGRALRADEV